MRDFFAFVDPVMFTIILAAVSALGMAAFVFGVQRLRRAMVVAGTPTAAIRSAAQGFGEFEGRAELLPGPPIVAPLTGTVCVWYRCKVFERRTEGNREWGVVTDETSDGLFLLRDYTGTSVIDPEGAVVTPAESVDWYTDSVLTGAPPSVGAPMGRYRCHEERIPERARLYVMGHFSTRGSTQEVPDTPAETRALLNAWKRDQAWLLQHFDADGDGVIDAHEWEAVRRAAGVEVARLQRERFGDGTMNVISKPEDGREFIISTAGEEQLLRRWRRQALLAFCAFVVAAGLAAWALSVRP